MNRTDKRRRIAHVVTKVFGLSGLRPGQQAVIDAVLAGTHTLAIMPTGAGKSLCYQVPAMLLPGTTVVVSPLIALMQDQFEKMSELGIASVQVNSAIPRDEVRRAHKKIGRRTVEFVFTTPEQLASDQFRTLLASAHVDLLVIDEAHCITQWGHDFRPAYLEALGAMRALGKPTVLALTATAPPEVIDDIAQQLNLGPLHIVNTGAHRPNLSYLVRPSPATPTSNGSWWSSFVDWRVPPSSTRRRSSTSSRFTLSCVRRASRQSRITAGCARMIAPSRRTPS